MNLNEIVVEVPQAEAVAIEYPGFIRNTQKALHTLGGINDIAAAVSSRHYLKLKLRPEDRTSHPLYGERLEQIRLLLRIARPRQQPSGATTSGCVVGTTGAGGKPAPAAAAGHGSSGSCKSSGAAAAAAAPQPAAPPGGGGGSSAATGVTARLVARVNPTFRFPGLADYAFVPHDPLLPARSRDMLPYDQRPDRAEPTKSAQPLLLIPQLFSWLDLPQDYAFKQVQSRVHLKAPPRVDPNWGDAPIISFYAEGVPPPVAATAGGVAAAAAAAAAEATKPAAAAGEDAVAAAAEEAARPADSAADGAPAAVAAAGGGDLGDVRAFRVLEAEVSRLLAQRPVWGLELIRERCAAGSAVQAAMPGGACDAVAVGRVVQRLCYRFKTGPWRGLFIRRGYDPRADVEARKYQAIIYSLPNNWYRAMLKAGVRSSLRQQVAAAPADGSAAAATASPSQAAAGGGGGGPADAASPVAAGASGAGGVASPAEAGSAAAAAAWSPLAPSCQDDLHFFRALPTQQSTTLQLIDLRLKEVQDTLQEPPHAADAARCSEKTGWFSNAALQRMQNAVQQRFLQLMEQLAPPGVGPQAAAKEAAAAATGDGAAAGGGAKASGSGDGAARGGDVEMTDAAASRAAAQPPRLQQSAPSGAAADEALRALIAQMNLRGLSEPGGDGGDLGVAGLFGSDDEDDEFRLLDDERDEDDARVGAGRRGRGMDLGVAGAAEAGGEQGRRRGGGADGGAGTGRGAAAQRAAAAGGDGEAAGEASDCEDSVYESEYDTGGDEEDDEEDADGDDTGGGGVMGRRPLGGGDLYGAGAYGRVTVPYDGGGVADRHLDGGSGAGDMFGSDDEDAPY